MKKINILFTTWTTNYGGSERFVANVAKYLDKKKYNLVVFSDARKVGPLKKILEKDGVKVISASYHRFKHPIKFLKQLKNVIESEHINIIHSNDDLNMIFPLLARGNAKFIAHSHSTGYYFTNNKLVSLLLSGIIKKHIAKHADLRLACGTDAGHALYGKRSFEVINNCIDINAFKYSAQKRKSVRDKYGISDESVVLLNIGRLAPVKNQQFLIEIFERYVQKNSDSVLLIIGDGQLGDELRKIVMSKKIDKNVIFLPGQSDVSSFYSAADIFVMPSLYEGMPIVAIEAQASGLHCIFSEAVTREADMTGNSRFIKLSAGLNVWIDAISDSLINNANRQCAILARYDAKSIAEKISVFYDMVTAEGETA